MAITSAFQADDVGSIPIRRSFMNLFSECWKGFMCTFGYTAAFGHFHMPETKKISRR
jgi:hypothetical protein